MKRLIPIVKNETPAIVFESSMKSPPISAIRLKALAEVTETAYTASK